MLRRDFLGLIGCAALPAETLPATWRRFELTTRIEVLKPAGSTRVWAPIACVNATPYQTILRNSFEASGGRVQQIRTGPDSPGMISAEFPAGTHAALEVSSRVQVRDWAIDLKKQAPHGAHGLGRYLRATKLLPTEGIVKERADAITRGARSDLAKAEAIYAWIVENTYRKPQTLGCGLGNIRFMLESGDLGGKCADLNSLFVGLSRAAGLPARDVFGIRVAKSETGLKSLGASSENVTKAQHCRAEVFLNDYGWVPVDPADVRKVALEEPPGPRPVTDPVVTQTRARLFGSWEMNWVAYNFAHDVALPGSNGPTLGFLMYPQAETGGRRLDCLDPEHFRYEIAARQI